MDGTPTLRRKCMAEHVLLEALRVLRHALQLPKLRRLPNHELPLLGAPAEAMCELRPQGGVLVAFIQYARQFFRPIRNLSNHPKSGSST